jgi:hypothetical protein
VATTTSSAEPPQASGERVSAERLAGILNSAPRDNRGRPRLVDAAFDGAMFPDDVSLKDVVFDGAVTFSQARFERTVSFAGAEFTGTATFDRAAFRGSALFDRVRFGGALWLNQASVRGRISFSQAALDRDATFDRTEFRGDLDFADAAVHGDVSFDMCVFVSPATFARTTFHAGASFGRVIAAQEFALSDATFHGKAFFGEGSYRGSIKTDGARFLRNPDLPSTLIEQRRNEPLDFIPQAASDAPSATDVLGYAPLVRAMHSLLDDESTSLPLAIAITAPWGMGKSSVMEQLMNALAVAHDDPRRYRTWATVKFPAWKYEQSEHLWAALAKEIYRQPQVPMRWWQKLRFRARLERRRLGWARFALKFGWPIVAAAAGVIALLTADLSASGTAVAGLTSAAGILSALSRYWRAISNPFKQAIDREASKPVYKAAPGFTDEADKDVECLGEVLCPDKRHAVAVFVDDLDRCSHAHVVDVVEAINQIFASKAGRPYVFVLGLDREMVSTNISVAYRDTVEGLKGKNEIRAGAFGTQFLAKIVQMSLALRPPDDEGMRNLLRSKTGGHAAEQRGDETADPSSDISEVSAATGRARQSSVDRAGYPVEVPEDLRFQPIKRIRDSKGVVEAEEAALGYLERNPRQVIRFHNAFRLQLHVASEQADRRFEMSGDELHALAKWVAIRLRWPELADADDSEEDLLTALEADANGRLGKVRLTDEKVERLKREYDKWFSDADLRRVLEDPLDRHLVTTLDKNAFLRVA